MTNFYRQDVVSRKIVILVIQSFVRKSEKDSMNNTSLNTKVNEPEYLLASDDSNESDQILSQEEKHWEKMFQMLDEFKNTHGHCLGHLNSRENIFLWKWIEDQRKNCYTLPADRKKRLDDIGFAWTRQDISWESNFLKIIEYKHKHGHCSIPQSYKPDPSFVSWAHRQKITKKTMKAYRKEKLTSIGFVWGISPELKWEESFLKLVDFKKNHGHCNVPNRYKSHLFLARWISTQRTKKSSLSCERKKRLDDLGFTWDPYDKLWEVNFLKLIKFKNKNGHCNVPRRFIDDPSLSIWVGNQRGKKEILSNERKNRLNDLGFDWVVFDTAWETNYRKLLEFKTKYGNFIISHSIDSPLSVWATDQRSSRKNLSPDKIKKLNDINFDWKPRSQRWEKNFQNLLVFRHTYGHCEVPRNFQDTNLSNWVHNQRRRKKSIEADRIHKLDGVGFTWSCLDKKAA